MKTDNHLMQQETCSNQHGSVGISTVGLGYDMGLPSHIHALASIVLASLVSKPCEY